MAIRSESAMASMSNSAGSALTRPQYMVGTPAKKVTFSCCISESAMRASKRGSSTSVAAAPNPALSCTLWPKEWNSGSVTRWTSCSTVPKTLWLLSAFMTMLAWVSSAPFGVPVVPLV